MMKPRLLTSIFAAALLVTFAIAVRSQDRQLSTITIVTEPSATVWVDGVRYGVTDAAGRLTVTSVEPAVRKVRVRASGFSELNKTIPATSRGDIPVKLVKTVDEAELAFQSAEELLSVDRARAIAEYDRAVKLRPKYFEAYIGLARAHAERGDIEKAFKAAETAKRLRPADPEAVVVEARLLKDSGEEDKAIAGFKRAIVLGRRLQPEAYTGLGLLYKDRAESAGGSGDYDGEAANYAESAKNLAVAVKQLGSAPDAIIVYQLLGLIYERQKKYKEAIALYETFLTIFPDVSEASAVASFIVQIKKQMAEPK